MIDGLTGLSYERFMLHYNFPPYSVGEVGRFGAPVAARSRPRQARLARAPARCCRPTRTSPIRSASSPTSPSPTARRRWRRSAAARCRMMDAGVPLKRPVSGIAMGLILEGKDFAVISRHPRRRGPSRRHGLQGRRHDRGHHLAADGHQDRRHHRGDHEGRARPGEGGPRPYPRRDGQGARPHPRGAVGSRAADRDDADRQGRRSATSSAPAARSSARSSPPPAPRSTSTTRA